MKLVYYYPTGNNAPANLSISTYKINILLKPIFSSNSSPTNLAVYDSLFQQFDTLSNILYNFSYSIFLFVVMLGLLIYLKKSPKYVLLFFFIPAIILFIIIYPGTLLGLGQMLIPHRIISFLEILLIPFGSYAIYILFNVSKKWSVSVTPVIILTFVMIFFFVTTPYICQNDPIYCQERVYTSELKNSEINALAWMSSYHHTGKNSIDNLISLFQLELLENSEFLIESYEPYDLNNPEIFEMKLYSDNLVLLREGIINNKELLIGGTFGSGKTVNIREKFIALKNTHAKVYSSKEGEVFAI